MKRCVMRRRSYSSLLRALRTDVKVQQELLRHADIATTLNIYAPVVATQKSEAASKITKLLLRPNTNGAVPGPVVVPTCT